MKRWPVVLEYPIVAITDVHGQRKVLEKLLRRLAALPAWDRTSVVFLGDYVDRGPDVRGTIDVVLDLAARHKAPVAAVSGNHDLALVRAAALDDLPASAYWIDGYAKRYDHGSTFKSYLGRIPRPKTWAADLVTLRQEIPVKHRAFLAGLAWVVEAEGHVFLHNGLSPELEQSAEEQLAGLRERRWDSAFRPRPGTQTEALWQLDYPPWLGADKRLADAPLPAPGGRVQVNGHKPVREPHANPVRIRLDTSGGIREPLTACVLAAPDATPVFIPSNAPRKAHK